MLQLTRAVCRAAISGDLKCTDCSPPLYDPKHADFICTLVDTVWGVLVVEDRTTGG